VELDIVSPFYLNVSTTIASLTNDPARGGLSLNPYPNQGYTLTLGGSGTALLNEGGASIGIGQGSTLTSVDGTLENDGYIGLSANGILNNSGPGGILNSGTIETSGNDPTLGATLDGGSGGITNSGTLKESGFT
jgi:hypothetical protein